MPGNSSRGLADVVAASTALSDIDGQAGRLFYRGYDINQLADSATFEEIAYLLQRGSPPSREELDGYISEIAAGRALGKLVAGSLPEVARSQEPMEALRSLVSLASAGDPDKDSNDPGPNLRKAARLTAQQPVFAATVYHYLRIPTDLFTPVFSVSRMAGWTAHIMEQHADNRLIRPDSEYIGESGLTWVPLDPR